MASDQSFVSFICDQLSQVPQISHRKMFGEYAIYCAGKTVAFVCNNQLYVKPTPGGKAVVGTPVDGFPYPGAKPHFLIEERLDDREWLSRLIEATARELPEPASKPARRPKPATQPRQAKKPSKAATAAKK